MGQITSITSMEGEAVGIVVEGKVSVRVVLVKPPVTGGEWRKNPIDCLEGRGQGQGRGWWQGQIEGGPYLLTSKEELSFD